MTRLALAVLASVLVPAPAGAAPMTGLRQFDGTHASGVALAGDRAVFGRGPAAGPLTISAQPLAGGAAGVLHRVERPRKGNALRLGSLAGSGTRVVAGVMHRFEPPPDSEGDPLDTDYFGDVLAGPPAGPLEVLETYAFPEGEGEIRSVAADVSGDLVALGRRDGDRLKVSVRDLASPGSPAQQLDVDGEPFSPVAIAGRYVAFITASNLSEGTITVVDHASGRRAYDVRVPGHPGRFDVQDDGTLVALSSMGATTVVGTASPESPQFGPRSTGGPGTDVAIAGGVVVFNRAEPDTLRFELRALDLATGAERRVSPPLVGLQELDFDGRRVAALNGRCLYGGDLPATDPGAAIPRGACRAVVLTLIPSGRWGKASRRMRILCQQGPGDRCSGTVTATVRLRNGRRRVVGRKRFDVPMTRDGRIVTVPVRTAGLRLRGRRVVFTAAGDRFVDRLPAER